MTTIRMGDLPPVETKNSHPPQVIEELAALKGVRPGQLIEVTGRTGKLEAAWFHGFLGQFDTTPEVK